MRLSSGTGRGRQMARLTSNYQPVLRSLNESEKWARASGDAGCLYVRLLIATDSAGRMRGRASHVLCDACSPLLDLGVTPMALEALLGELDGLGLIRRYEVDGDEFLEVCGYFEPPRREKGRKPFVSIFPDPPMHSETGDLRQETETRDHKQEAMCSHGEPTGDERSPLGTVGYPRVPVVDPVVPKPQKKAPGPTKADKLSALVDAEAPVGTDLATVAAVGRACEDWRAYRVEAKRSAYTAVSWRKNLKDAWEDPELFAASVDHSIQMGYQGIFPPKTAAKNGTKSETMQEHSDRLLAGMKKRRGLL